MLNTDTWKYEDGTWSDLLTDFCGQKITYDEIGNPVKVDELELTWNGRQLTHINNDGLNISYAYNGDGLRTSKEVDGVKTECFYNGSLLAGQKTGDDVIVFMYDNNGDIFGFTYNGTEYYYVKNLQNDVTAITDSNGNIVVNYYYDAWGNPTDTTGNAELAELNPIRYRSYYFDEETAFYYLNSRYYAPVIGRFLNADECAQTGQGMLDKNMFAYCENNPIVREDNDGEFWNIIAGALIGGGMELAGQLLSGKSFSEVNWAKVGVSTLSGGLTAAVGPVAGCLISGATDVALDAIDGKINTFGDAVKSFTWGTAKAAVSYGIGTAVGKVTRKLTKVEKVGRMGKNGYPGVKYSYNKGHKGNRAVRSIELHSRHNGHGVHLQGNKWNPKTGTRSGVFFRKTLWR